MKIPKVLTAAGLITLGAFACLAIKAFADGIPSPNALYYAGTLTEGGVLVNGLRAITVNLWPDGTTAGMPLCTTLPQMASVNGGRFRVPLPPACKSAVNQNANAWVEVVDGSTSLGRTPVGAVPYSVEADHAVNATLAANATSAVTAATANAAGGTLATTISTIQGQLGQLHTPSAFRATLKTTETVPSGMTTTIPFDTVNFDLNNEYDVTTGVFTPKAAGVYLVSCELQYLMATSTSACSVGIAKNGAQVTAIDSPTLPPITTGGPHCVPTLTTTVQAAAGDMIACTAYQFSAASGTSTLDTSATRNWFGAARLY
jgi:hypothetical protein